MIMKNDDYHLQTILANMCRVVGCDYLTLDTSQDDWYYSYSWSEKIEQRFNKWLVDYIHKIKGAQLELFGRRYMKKQECVEAASMFLLCYGWKRSINE